LAQRKQENITSTTPGKLAWRKFKRNPLAMSGLIFILLLIGVCLAGPSIRPDSTIDSNDQNLLLSKKTPGFEVQTIRLQKEISEVDSWGKRWLNGGSRKTYEEIPVKSITILKDSIQIIRFGDEMAISYPASILITHGSHGAAEDYLFSRKFLLGTDKYGRDLLSRLMAGTIISLSVGIIAVLISLLVGLTLGLVAGYFRGWVDNVIMWFTNVVWAIPTLLLVMAITFAFGTGFWKVFIAVGLTMWVEVARIARGQVLSVREKEYIEAAKALGFSQTRIIFKHVLPNILSPVIVISAANFASAILIEAGLSFLGLGAQIPAPSWGNMIREHYAFITTDLAYLAVIPGVLIMLLVLSFMMVGNGLRDALDVKE
jgi:peptide/nickel transport system permease protein